MAAPKAEAYPFQPNPEAFAAYMNTRTWKSGSKITFSNLVDCHAGTPDDVVDVRRGQIGSTPYRYSCQGGFVQISNPMGIKICELERLVYTSSSIAQDPRYRTSSFAWVGPPTWNYRTLNCRYR